VRDRNHPPTLDRERFAYFVVDVDVDEARLEQPVAQLDRDEHPDRELDRRIPAVAYESSIPGSSSSSLQTSSACRSLSSSVNNVS
jgi:hypothetical protein